MISELKKLERRVAFKAAVCLLAVSVGFSGTVQAAPLVPAAVSVLATVNLPEAIGKVEERFQPEQSLHDHEPAIVLVRDAHANPEAQRNIRNILNYLSENHAMKQIAAEGAFGPVVADPFNVFAVKEANQAVADALLVQGELTGVESYALSESAGRTRVTGVEDPELYRESYHLFANLKSEKEQILSRFHQWERLTGTLAAKTLNKQLYRLVRSRKRWEEHREGSFEHFRLLRDFALEYLRLDLTNPRNQFDWPHLARILKIDALEGNVLKDKVQVDQKKLLRMIKLARMDEKDRRYFTEGFEHLFSGAEMNSWLAAHPHRYHIRSLRVFMEFFRRETRDEIEMTLFPQLMQKTGVQILREEIDAGMLFREMENLGQSLEMELVEKERERELVRVIRDFSLIKAMVNLEMTREGYEEYQARRAQIRKNRLQERMSGLAGVEETKLPPLSDAWLDAAEKFYEKTRLRDQRLIENTLAAISENNTGPVALVAGGFHSEGLSAVLKQRNIAHMIVTPKISSFPDPDLYERVLLGERSDEGFRVAGTDTNVSAQQKLSEAGRFELRTDTLGAQYLLTSGNVWREVAAAPQERQWKALLGAWLDDGIPALQAAGYTGYQVYEALSTAIRVKRTDLFEGLNIAVAYDDNTETLTIVIPGHFEKTLSLAEGRVEELDLKALERVHAARPQTVLAELRADGWTDEEIGRMEDLRMDDILDEFRGRLEVYIRHEHEWNVGPLGALQDLRAQRTPETWETQLNNLIEIEENTPWVQAYLDVQMDMRPSDNGWSASELATMRTLSSDEILQQFETELLHRVRRDSGISEAREDQLWQLTGQGELPVGTVEADPEGEWVMAYGIVQDRIYSSGKEEQLEPFTEDSPVLPIPGFPSLREIASELASAMSEMGGEDIDEFDEFEEPEEPLITPRTYEHEPDVSLFERRFNLLDRRQLAALREASHSRLGPRDHGELISFLRKVAEEEGYELMFRDVWRYFWAHYSEQAYNRRGVEPEPTGPFGGGIAPNEDRDPHEYRVERERARRFVARASQESAYPMPRYDASQVSNREDLIDPTRLQPVENARDRIRIQNVEDAARTVIGVLERVHALVEDFSEHLGESYEDLQGDYPSLIAQLERQIETNEISLEDLNALIERVTAYYETAHFNLWAGVLGDELPEGHNTVESIRTLIQEVGVALNSFPEEFWTLENTLLELQSEIEWSLESLGHFGIPVSFGEQDEIYDVVAFYDESDTLHVLTGYDPESRSRVFESTSGESNLVRAASHEGLLNQLGQAAHLIARPNPVYSAVPPSTENYKVLSTREELRLDFNHDFEGPLAITVGDLHAAVFERLGEFGQVVRVEKQELTLSDDTAAQTGVVSLPVIDFETPIEHALAAPGRRVAIVADYDLIERFRYQHDPEGAAPVLLMQALKRVGVQPTLVYYNGRRLDQKDQEDTRSELERFDGHLRSAFGLEESPSPEDVEIMLDNATLSKQEVLAMGAKLNSPDALPVDRVVLNEHAKLHTFLNKDKVEAERARWAEVARALEQALAAHEQTELELYDGLSALDLTDLPEFTLSYDSALRVMAVGVVLGFWQLHSRTSQTDQQNLLPLLVDVNRSQFARFELRTAAHAAAQQELSEAGRFELRATADDADESKEEKLQRELFNMIEYVKGMGLPVDEQGFVDVDREVNVLEEYPTLYRQLKTDYTVWQQDNPSSIEWKTLWNYSFPVQINRIGHQGPDIYIEGLSSSGHRRLMVVRAYTGFGGRRIPPPIADNLRLNGHEATALEGQAIPSYITIRSGWVSHVRVKFFDVELAGADTVARRPLPLVEEIEHEHGTEFTRRKAVHFIQHGMAKGRPVAGAWDTVTPDAAKDIIHWLGWVKAPSNYDPWVPTIVSQAEEMKEQGYKKVVLLAAGGSFWGAQALRDMTVLQPGFPELIPLDLTDPAAIRRTEALIDGHEKETLVIVASKSGTTADTTTLLRHFEEKIGNPQQVIGITDPGRLIDGQDDPDYLHIWRNDPEIGGRFSVLSFFGLLPAALTGVDIWRVMHSALERENIYETNPRAATQTLSLAEQLIKATRAGRNKWTLRLSEDMQTLGPWMQQLVNESLGKREGAPLLVVGESTAREVTSAYGDDRIIIELKNTTDGQFRVRQTKEGETPHLIITVPDLENNLGALLYDLEITIALVGYFLGINPFNQPGVEEAKKRTRELLADPETEVEQPQFVDGDIQVYYNELSGLDESMTAKEAIEFFIEGLEPRDYFALFPYTYETPDFDEVLLAIRTRANVEQGVATIGNVGPRFEHSDSQGVNDNPGSVILLTFEPEAGEDIPIPDSENTFQQLTFAKAQANYGAFSHSSRTLHLHLPSEYRENPDKLRDLFGVAPRNELRAFEDDMKGLLTGDESDRVVVLIDAPFEGNHTIALNALNMGRTENVFVLNSPTFAIPQFLYDARNNPKAVGVPLDMLRQTGIIPPRGSGIIDPSKWSEARRERGLEQLRKRIVRLGELSELPQQALADYEEHKFDTLQVKKTKVSVDLGTFSVYGNAHPHDLWVRNRAGQRQLVRLYDNSPVVPADVTVESIGDETRQLWLKLISEARGVVVIQDREKPTVDIDSILGESGARVVRVFTDETQKIERLKETSLWKSQEPLAELRVAPQTASFAEVQQAFSDARPVLSVPHARYIDRRDVTLDVTAGYWAPFSGALDFEGRQQAARFLAWDLFHFGPQNQPLTDAAGYDGASLDFPGRSKPSAGGLEFRLLDALPQDPTDHFYAAAKALSAHPHLHLRVMAIGVDADAVGAMDQAFDNRYSYTGFDKRYEVVPVSSSRFLNRALAQERHEVFNLIRGQGLGTLREFSRNITYSSAVRELLGETLSVTGSWVVLNEADQHPAVQAALLHRESALALGMLEAQLIEELKRVLAQKGVLSSDGLLVGMDLALVRSLWSKELKKRFFAHSA